MGLESASYDLKVNSKPLDLSQTLQQSCLPSGAKLELVLASRTPAPVSVALDLPDYLASAASTKRFTEKFSSSTTLWLVLRKFELNGGHSFNLTARASLGNASGDASVADRMFYDEPVLNIMGRKFFGFMDLQKTLRQLGFHSGTCLIRLEYKRTDQLIKEAMKQITEYFEESPTEPAPKITDKSLSTPLNASNDLKCSSIQVEDVSDLPSPSEPTTCPTTSNLDPGTGDRPTTVFRPPMSSIPQAACIPYEEDDFEPTIAHAKLHQSRLLNSSRNVKLPSDVEIEKLQKMKAARLHDIAEVSIKIRYPDQTTSVSSFKPDETGNHLYAFVSKLIIEENQPFKLIWRDRDSKTVPNNEKRLVNDLGFGPRMLLYFVWDGPVESNNKSAILKQQYMEDSQEINIPNLSPQKIETHEPEEKRNGVKKQKGEIGRAHV